jgi:hypothetical protein
LILHGLLISYERSNDQPASEFHTAAPAGAVQLAELAGRSRIVTPRAPISALAHEGLELRPAQRRRQRKAARDLAQRRVVAGEHRAIRRQAFWSTPTK